MRGSLYAVLMLMRVLLAARNFVTGRFQRTGAAPAPDQNHVLAGCVVEAVPVTPFCEYDVAFARRLVALVGVDRAVTFENQKKLVRLEVTVTLVPRAGRKDRPAQNQFVRMGGLLIDQELNLHVDPALFGR